MRIEATTIDGVHRLVPTPHHDERGWFSRTFDAAVLAEAGLVHTFVQHNQSRSRRGVVRGLHVRVGASEEKVFRVARGQVFEAVVDTRPWSPTFRRVETFVLDDVTMTQLYLPRGVAHGFQVLSEEADVCYLHAEPYVAGADVAIAWDDPALAIAWPVAEAVVSARDAHAPRLDALDLDGLFDPTGSDPTGSTRQG
jgi:dTDP-4-dehydrorhamnose 3,5-epimerase